MFNASQRHSDMNVPRHSQSAEVARAAALQAEFNEKKWVWVPDEKEGYLAGWVNHEDEAAAQVVMSAGGEIRRVPLYALSKMNPPKFDRVDDIADLTFLNEASVVHNLRLRYGSGAIYTYSGLFLVSINPYQNLPLYTDAIIQQYRNKRRDENPPHIFAVSERAWVNMQNERENQSILITGESGAGKTESTKKVIQYLSAIATDALPPGNLHVYSPSIPQSGLPRGTSFRRKSVSLVGSGSSLTAKGRLGLLERQIIQANPILEAFGNAQTQRNNNSSRFGKFIRISFSPDGSISGRVVVRSPAERNFHVFYQLLSGGIPIKDSLLLDGRIEDYEFLNRSKREVDGVNDRDDWDTLINAFEVVGFSRAEQFDLFRVVAAILHIGNIAIISTRTDDAAMADPSQAERVCHLLGIPVSEFTKAVLHPKVLAGREWVMQTRTGQQALDELAALCKTLYEKSFGALVDRINRALDRPTSKSTFIGVLDIAGFEIFDINTYEQLLINYTNEKLQQFFNHHMFVLEQEEYSREGIEWDYCTQCGAGELRLGEQPHLGRSKYNLPKFEQGFIITHYAGKVEYRTDGWLEKNKDPLNDNLVRVLAASTEPYIASFLPSPSVGYSVGKKRSVKKGAFRTVAQRHREQLSLLMAQLHATQPHFVRCIVPNTNKKPARIDVPLVLDQLRCNGVLEGIRIARLGYPNRLPFVEFRQRYEILTPGIIPRGYMDGRKACLRMVEALELDGELYRCWNFEDFLQGWDALLYDVFSKLQAVARKFSARRQMKKILNRAVAIRTIQRNARLYGELRDWPWWQLYTKARPKLQINLLYTDLGFRCDHCLRLPRPKNKRSSTELEAERALTLDKDTLLERSKQLALHADLDALDSQLDGALKLQKESDEKYDQLRQAFDQAAGRKEGEFTDLLPTMERSILQLQDERDGLQKVNEEVEQLERSGRHTKDQLAELTRTATEYTSIIQRKEEEAARLTSEVSASKRELAQLQKELIEHRALAEKHQAELSASKADAGRTLAAKAKLQMELDELRALMETKTTEETRRREAQKSMEQELVDLRDQSGLSGQYKQIEATYSSLLERERMSKENSTKAEATVASLEKALRSRQIDTDGQLSEALRAKESLERQLVSAQSKYNEIEDTALQLERDTRARERQLETSRKQLEAESAKCKQLQQAVANQKRELNLDKARLGKLDAALKKALADLSDREWEIKQLESRQEKTIVEHVHVLEKAKKGYGPAAQRGARRTAEECSNALVREAEDYVAKQKWSRWNFGPLRKPRRSMKEKASKALSALETERKSREIVESSCRRLQSELSGLRSELELAQDQLAVAQRAKTGLENELAKLADDIDAQDSRSALLAQRRTSAAELEDCRKRLREVSHSKKQVESELVEVRNKLDAEITARAEATSAHAQLKVQVQELQISSSALLAKQTEFQEAIESYRQKLKIASDKLQESRHTYTDLEKAHNELTAEKKAIEEKLHTTERKLRELEHVIEEEERESSELGIHRHRLVHQLQEEREQHKKDVAEREFASDQTRKKYQGSARRIAKSTQDYDELRLRFNEEVYNGGAWKREKERLETKIMDLTKAYETSTGTQSDQQAQIVALHSQVRELRSVLNDAEADRAMLQKARRSLQAELEGIKLDHADANKMSSDREMQKLQLEKLDLERSLEEQEDRVAMASERMRNAETHAAQSQLELDQIRLENTDLERKNAVLEKQVKELNVRIVDLETKAYANLPQPSPAVRQLEARIEELTTQLNQASSDKRHSTPLRSSEKAFREMQLQLSESERKCAMLESLSETATDTKQATLTLERQVERLQNRISRPMSVVSDSSSTVIGSTASSVGSPKKYKGS
ncbi:P-loop containing nucleoside triphosphate hydrolase protein [Pisolithus microcarpus]|nr:P-loop containing nucleoside triphosphate hydrolase protein [Pisolithus microcarpus]